MTNRDYLLLLLKLDLLDLLDNKLSKNLNTLLI